MNLILVLFLFLSVDIIHCGKGGKGGKGGKIEAPVKLKNLICEYNETWIKGESCEVKSHSRVKRTAEIRAHLLKTVKNANLVFNVYKRFSDWKPWVMRNFTIDGCDFVAGKNNLYLNIIKTIIKNYTSFNHSCPYPPGPLIISGVDLRDMALGTLVLPDGEYRLDLQVNTPQNFKIFTFKFIAENEAPVKLKNLICEYNETWIKGESCVIKAHSRVKRTAEIRAHLLKTVKYANFVFSVYKRFSGWKPWVMKSITVNACEFLAGKNNIYLNIIKTIIKKYTSVNHSCPYPPGPVIISGLGLRDMALGTLILPGGEYQLDLQVNTPQNFKICRFKFIAEVWEKF